MFFGNLMTDNVELLLIIGVTLLVVSWVIYDFMDFPAQPPSYKKECVCNNKKKNRKKKNEKLLR
jgi:hypothetical protein